MRKFIMKFLFSVLLERKAIVTPSHYLNTIKIKNSTVTKLCENMLYIFKKTKKIYIHYSKTAKSGTCKKKQHDAHVTKRILSPYKNTLTK